MLGRGGVVAAALPHLIPAAWRWGRVGNCILGKGAGAALPKPLPGPLGPSSFHSGGL